MSASSSSPAPRQWCRRTSPIDLPEDRDQLNTRSLPRFTELSHHVYEQIQLAKKGHRPAAAPPQLPALAGATTSVHAGADIN